MCNLKYTLSFSSNKVIITLKNHINTYFNYIVLTTIENSFEKAIKTFNVIIIKHNKYAKINLIDKILLYLNQELTKRDIFRNLIDFIKFKIIYKINNLMYKLIYHKIKPFIINLKIKRKMKNLKNFNNTINELLRLNLKLYQNIQ